MKSFIVLSALFALCAATAPSGPYSFGYSTADGQSRQESGHGGAVTGSYSYIDANGDLRQVRYVADALGYRAEGDVSVDKRTAAAAAALAAIAPKAALPAPIASVAPAPGPLPLAYSAPFAAYSNWGYAAPVAAPVAHLAAPVAPWAVGPRGYKVVTPTHQINFQI